MYNFTVSRKKKSVVFNLGNGAVIKVKGKSICIYDSNGNERVLKFGEACNTFKVDMDGNEVVNVRAEGEFERTIRGIFKRFYGFDMANEVPALALLYANGDDNVVTRTNQDGITVCAHNGTNYWFSPELCSSVDAEILCTGGSALIPSVGSTWITPKNKLVSEYFKSNAFFNDINGNHRSKFDPIDEIYPLQLKQLGFYMPSGYFTKQEFIDSVDPDKRITAKMYEYYLKMCTYTSYEKPMTIYAYRSACNNDIDDSDPIVAEVRNHMQYFLDLEKDHERPISNDDIVDFIANALEIN